MERSGYHNLATSSLVLYAQSVPNMATLMSHNCSLDMTIVLRAVFVQSDIEIHSRRHKPKSARKKDFKVN